MHITTKTDHHTSNISTLFMHRMLQRHDARVVPVRALTASPFPPLLNTCAPMPHRLLHSLPLLLPLSVHSTPCPGCCHHSRSAAACIGSDGVRFEPCWYQTVRLRVRGWGLARVLQGDPSIKV